MNLVLIGYRCTGKTTIGRLLADRLDWPLVDTDTLIQLRARKSIKEIVAAGGWPEFRLLERKVVADVSALDRQVISAGGGAILDAGNRKALRAGGLVILLTAAPQVIWQRMKADPKTLVERPNLTDAGGIAEVQSLLAERRPLYEAACHQAIATDQVTSAAAAEQILGWLKAAGHV